MDEDPAVEPELDTFSLILPLPYRIAVIFVLGIASQLSVAIGHGLILSRYLGMGR